MEGEVNVKEEEKDEILVLRIAGRLDAISSPEMEKKVAGLIDGGKTKILMCHIDTI